jgi:hypothetical protein
MRLHPRVVSLLLAALLLAPASARSQSPSAPARDNLRAAAPTGTARIRGRVVSQETGQPLRRATVGLTSPQLRERRTASTDRDGRYEFRDLPAGRYTLDATKEAYVNVPYGQTRPMQPGRPLELKDDQIADRIDFALPRGAVITGRVLDEFGEPAIDVNVMPLRSQYSATQGRRLVPSGRSATTNDIGEFRIFGLAAGEYYLSATAQNRFGGVSVDSSDDRSGYAPTYYPNTPDMALAQRIVVGPGQVAPELVIMLVPTRTARVSGVVIDADNQPAKRGSVNARPRGATFGFMSGGGAIRPDGSFVIPNLPPGTYQLRATTGAPSPDAPPTFSAADVTVNGEDVAGVRLLPARPVPIRGVIVVDPAAAGARPPRGLRVLANARNMDDAFGMPVVPGPVADDLSFEAKGYPGLVNLVPTLPAGWIVNHVRQNGEDVTDAGVAIGSEGAEGIEIEITNRVGALNGSVTNDRGEAVADFTAVLFPDARDVPPTGGRGGVARADQDGRFVFRTVRPGDYRLIALEAVDISQWSDPDYLEQLRVHATRISVGPAETQTIDLKLATQP